MRIWLRIAIQIIAAIAFSSAIAGPNEDFFRAIDRDDAYSVKRMIERGFDANAAREKGASGLLVAVRDGSPRVVEALLALPAIQVDVANEAGETPLMMAALRGRKDWVLKLLERGAQINRSGWTPLHYAASGPEPGLVTLLLERGADIQARAANGNTALMMAARYGAMDTAGLLLARGADPRPRNAAGLSAADFARGAGRDALAAQLEAAAR